ARNKRNKKRHKEHFCVNCTYQFFFKRTGKEIYGGIKMSEDIREIVEICFNLSDRLEEFEKEVEKIGEQIKQQEQKTAELDRKIKEIIKMIRGE
ncbi:MAG: hypothetical protein ABC579_07220, partial [Candidatus Methanosuratincola petrocarbonis]